MQACSERRPKSLRAAAAHAAAAHERRLKAEKVILMPRDENEVGVMMREG